MDWFSWLFKTNLDPSLVYEYGLAFSSNELQLQDTTYFTHDLLQSMGISIAKHRLEILKLAKKENNDDPIPKNTNNLSKLIKKCLRKCLRKLSFHEEVKEKKKMVSLPQETNWQEGKWRRALVSGENKGMVNRSRKIAMSGPLDNGRLMHEKMMMSNKVLRFSGPIDGRFSGPISSNNRSPMLNRVLDEWAESPMGYEIQSPYNYDDSAMWSALFEDLKPT